MCFWCVWCVALVFAEVYLTDVFGINGCVSLLLWLLHGGYTWDDRLGGGREIWMRRWLEGGGGEIWTRRWLQGGGGETRLIVHLYFFFVCV